MTRKKRDQINLLPKHGMATTVSGRVTLWILSSFRIVVIVTEIIVMIAFLSRFWLDAQNTDLNEELEQKVKVLSATKRSEDEFRDIQNRLNTYSEISDKTVEIDDVFIQLSEVIPVDIDLTLYNYDEGLITIEGESPNERLIQQYISNINARNMFINTRLIKLETPKNDISKLIFTINTQHNL